MARKDNKEIKGIFKQINTLIKPSGDHATAEKDQSWYEEQINKQQRLLQELSLWFRASEDRRKVMEKRNRNLLTENEELRNTVSLEREKMGHIHQKFKYLQSNHEKFVQMKEEYKNLKESRRKCSLEDKVTSISDLTFGTEKGTQTGFPTECVRCKLSSARMCKKQLAGKEPSINLTKSELSRLEEDMQELKSVLVRREDTWTKMAEREKEQRTKLTKMNAELSNLRQVAGNRKTELEAKTQALKSISVELRKTQKDVVVLKKHISKVEDMERKQAWWDSSWCQESMHDRPVTAPRLYHQPLPKPKHHGLKASSISYSPGSSTNFLSRSGRDLSDFC